MIARFFLTIDSLLLLGLGVLLFLQPHLVASFVFSSETDGVHWHLVRCVGGQLLAASFVCWKMRSSTNAARTMCHILRIVPAILILLLVFQCRSMTPDLVKLEYLEIAKYACIAGITTHVFLLLLNKWTIGSSLMPNNKLGDCLYQLDAIASICIGVAWLAFPNWLLHRQVNVELTDSHSLCGRLMGALFVSSFAVSSHALHWSSKVDRTTAVEARVICCVFILTAQVWSQIAYKVDWSGGHWVGISLFSTWTILSIIYRAGLHFVNRQKKTN